LYKNFSTRPYSKNRTLKADASAKTGDLALQIQKNLRATPKNPKNKARRRSPDIKNYATKIFRDSSTHKLKKNTSLEQNQATTSHYKNAIRKTGMVGSAYIDKFYAKNSIIDESPIGNFLMS
jgi:hypothetical protein